MPSALPNGDERGVVGIPTRYRAHLALASAVLLLGLFCVRNALSLDAAHHSTQDETLFRGTPYPYKHNWLDAAELVHTRMAPHSLIAYSEMGYTPYTNLDKRFLDVRGLTDREIAHLPGLMRSTIGIIPNGWLTTDGSLRQSIFSRRPDYLMSIDDASSTRMPARVGDYVYANSVVTASDTIHWYRLAKALSPAQ